MTKMQNKAANTRRAGQPARRSVMSSQTVPLPGVPTMANNQPISRPVQRLFLLLSISLFLSAGICHGAEHLGAVPKWMESGHQLRLRAWPDKPIYRSGEKITMTFSLTNMAGGAKQLQRGSAFVQYIIKVSRDGKMIEYDQERLMERLLGGWSFSPSDPIPVGKSHRETLDMDNALDVSIPGKYVISFRKWFLRKDAERLPPNPRDGIDYLDATAAFTVLPHQAP